MQLYLLTKHLNNKHLNNKHQLSKSFYEQKGFNLTKYLNNSFFINFNHFKIYRLICGAFIFCSKDHHFVAWETETLFFRHFQN
jgi:Zn-dependent M28 family amino/carboxypeptidase